MDWCGPADKSGITTLGYDSDPFVPTILHDLADLFHRLGLDDDLTLSMVLVHPVVIERSQIVLAR